MPQKKGYIEAEVGDAIDISGRMQYHRGTVQKGISQTTTATLSPPIVVIVWLIPFCTVPR